MPTAPFAWTHEKTRVEFDGRALTVDDKLLPLDQIERLSRFLSRSTAQGSWGRLDCGVNLLANGERAKVSFRGDATTEQWGPWRPLWDELDAMVRNEIEPRLLERTIRQVADGTRAEIYPVQREGTRPPDRDGREPAGAEDVLQTDPVEGDDRHLGRLIQITTVDPNGKQRKHNTGFGDSEWDAWQIPHLWHHFGAR